LATWVTINSMKAFTLFDSGNIADAISPDFARNAKVKVFHLENPVMLQLGTKGSRSKITYGCTLKYSIESMKNLILHKEYFDIANVDCYDAIVGTVFMRCHGIIIDFNDDTIKLKGSVVPTLSEGEE
ncbi:hypothetical protein L218DRAFT_813709, partial [Marasmius fiardii PR-910]